MAAAPARVVDAVADYTVVVDAPGGSAGVVDDMRANAW
jgi:hypothetical protein